MCRKNCSETAKHWACQAKTISNFCTKMNRKKVLFQQEEVLLSKTKFFPIWKNLGKFFETQKKWQLGPKLTNSEEKKYLSYQSESSFWRQRNATIASSTGIKYARHSALRIQKNGRKTWFTDLRYISKSAKISFESNIQSFGNFGVP